METNSSLTPGIGAFFPKVQDQEMLITLEETSPTFLAADLEEMGYVLHLHRLGRLLCTLTAGHLTFFCQEVEKITRGRATLLFGKQPLFPPTTFSALQLQFQDRRYGYLALLRDETRKNQPAISLFTAHMMAQAISCILHMLDYHLFLKALEDTLDSCEISTLTGQEQNILSLLCQGQSRETIAKTLYISLPTLNTHLRHIYEKLCVHNEYEVKIRAFNAGLFSFIK